MKSQGITKRLSNSFKKHSQEEVRSGSEHRIQDSRAMSLNFGTIDILGQIMLCCACCSMLIITVVLGIYPVDANSILHPNCNN
jgi:hypothetical protein